MKNLKNAAISVLKTTAIDSSVGKTLSEAFY